MYIPFNHHRTLPLLNNYSSSSVEDWSTISWEFFGQYYCSTCLDTPMHTHAARNVPKVIRRDDLRGSAGEGHLTSYCIADQSSFQGRDTNDGAH